MKSLDVLIDDIVNGTLDGTLKWKFDAKNMWNTETSYYFTNTLSDSVTKLTMKVVTNKDFTLDSGGPTSIIIVNPNFKSGFIVCNNHEYRELDKISNFLYYKEVINILPVNTDDNVALEILKNNKEFLQKRRDDKINYLLEKENENIDKTDCSIVDQVKKESFLKRVLKLINI